MSFGIDDKIFDGFPNLNIGLVIAKELDNSGLDPELIDIIREKENK